MRSRRQGLAHGGRGAALRPGRWARRCRRPARTRARSQMPRRTRAPGGAPLRSQREKVSRAGGGRLQIQIPSGESRPPEHVYTRPPCRKLAPPSPPKFQTRGLPALLASWRSALRPHALSLPSPPPTRPLPRVPSPRPPPPSPPSQRARPPPVAKWRAPAPPLTRSSCRGPRRWCRSSSRTA